MRDSLYYIMLALADCSLVLISRKVRTGKQENALKPTSASVITSLCEVDYEVEL